jgi:hypothetical protein
MRGELSHMDWLEQNLDAYRIVAEILSDFRTTVRDELERAHGSKWFRTALPDGLLDRLIESKEQERAIDWYESEYQQVIDYAVFPDLLEILEHNASLFPQIMKLAPSHSLLHARFLELEVMRSKLGRTRPISEAELSFLGTFHLRFRKAVAEFASAPKADRVTPDASPQKESTGTSGATETPPEKPKEKAKDAEPQVASSASSEDTTVTIDEPQPTDGDDGGSTEQKRPASAGASAIGDGPRPAQLRPPTRSATTMGTAPKASGGGGGPAAAVATAEPESEPEQRKMPLAEALAKHESRVVLRELYREVTNIADGIWSSDILPVPAVWEEVCTSDWYEQSFSRLNLKPVSDFYEIISKVEEKMSTGIARDELQTYLKESNFAKVLLALRDMFQKNGL